MTPLSYYKKASASDYIKGRKLFQCSGDACYALFFAVKYSSIATAAFLPAPIARITVAAPVTMSPPAYTPGTDVAPVSGSASM